MNFKIKRSEFLFLALIVFLLGCMQVLTPLFMRTLIDGIMPSKDRTATMYVLLIIGINEILLVVGNSLFSRELDGIEKHKLSELRNWMFEEGFKLSTRIKNAEAFYSSWSNDTGQLVYKEIKNKWYRVKDFTVLILLSFICVNISPLAGILIIVITSLSFVLVKLSQEKQNSDIRMLYQRGPEEKELFNQIVNGEFTKENTREIKLERLKVLSQEVTQIKSSVAAQRTKFQDINNTLRFVMMFSIISFGGYLFTNDLLTMGSLWTLLITMYRIIPPAQSIVRWLLQTRSEENLEDRILRNIKNTETFNKPAYYNRMVKVIENFLKEPGLTWVQTDSSINADELLQSAEIWRSFYSQKDNILITKEVPEVWLENKIYFLIGAIDMTPPYHCIIFSTREVSPELKTLVKESKLSFK